MSIDQLLSDDNSTLNFPTIRPSLDLNFARTKSLDPRITFTRSSGGSYVGPDGLIKYAGVNQPRFDHNPTTGESLGLMIEESRTNLISYSDDFSNVSWKKNNYNVTADATTAPDGTLTADKLIAINANTFHDIFKSPVSGSDTYTLSIFAKAAEQSFIRLRIDDGVVGRGTFFNLSNGSIGSSVNVTSSTITPYPNGWYRCSITVTTNIINVVFNSFPTGSNTNYTGNGTSGLYIWGAQLELGAFPTSYIPTVASTRTRAADNASMTGTKFSSWYNQSEGTFYSTVKSTTSGYIISARSLSSGGDRHQLSQTGGATIVSNVITATFPNTYKNQTKQAYRYSTNNFSFVSDKDRISQKFSGSIPTNISYATIGRADFGLISTLNGTISRLTYYPKGLPNSQLQALTR
jgi:hypothetical protein